MNLTPASAAPVCPIAPGLSELGPSTTQETALREQGAKQKLQCLSPQQQRQKKSRDKFIADAVEADAPVNAGMRGYKASALVQATKPHSRQTINEYIRHNADIFDASPKDDTASMEHPLFALRAGDKRVRTYERGACTVTVKPGHDGCATIHDKDLWIYAISQLVEAKNRGRKIERTVRFTAYDFLKTTNRDVSGRAYERMAAMLARLRGTSVETNIETAGQRERRGFGLVDSWRVIERDQDERMVAVEVTLPEWLFRSVDAMRVLTLSHEYFRLRKPLDRRIYELARKHCGAQAKWRVTVAVLYQKSGSSAPLRNFRIDLRALIEAGALPGYRMVFDAAGDAMIFYAKAGKGALAQIRDAIGR